MSDREGGFLGGAMDLLQKALGFAPVSDNPSVDSGGLQSRIRRYTHRAVSGEGFSMMGHQARAGDGWRDGTDTQRGQIDFRKRQEQSWQHLFVETGKRSDLKEWIGKEFFLDELQKNAILQSVSYSGSNPGFVIFHFEDMPEGVASRNDQKHLRKLFRRLPPVPEIVPVVDSDQPSVMQESPVAPIVIQDILDGSQAQALAYVIRSIEEEGEFSPWIGKEFVLKGGVRSILREVYYDEAGCATFYFDGHTPVRIEKNRPYEILEQIVHFPALPEDVLKELPTLSEMHSANVSDEPVSPLPTTEPPRMSDEDVGKLLDDLRDQAMFERNQRTLQVLNEQIGQLEAIQQEIDASFGDAAGAISEGDYATRPLAPEELEDGALPEETIESVPDIFMDSPILDKSVVTVPLDPVELPDLMPSGMIEEDVTEAGLIQAQGADAVVVSEKPPQKHLDSKLRAVILPVAMAVVGLLGGGYLLNKSKPVQKAPATKPEPKKPILQPKPQSSRFSPEIQKSVDMIGGTIAEPLKKGESIWKLAKLHGVKSDLWPAKSTEKNNLHAIALSNQVVVIRGDGVQKGKIMMPMTDEIAKNLRPGDVVVIKTNDFIDQKAIPEQNRYHFHGSVHRSNISSGMPLYDEVAFTPVQVIDEVRKSEEAIIEKIQAPVLNPVSVVDNKILNNTTSSLISEVKEDIESDILDEPRVESGVEARIPQSGAKEALHPVKILLDREITSEDYLRNLIEKKDRGMRWKGENVTLSGGQRARFEELVYIGNVVRAKVSRLDTGVSFYVPVDVSHVDVTFKILPPIPKTKDTKEIEAFVDQRLAKIVEKKPAISQVPQVVPEEKKSLWGKIKSIFA